MIEAENKAYWTDRAAGYSALNQAELETRQRQVWRGCLTEQIAACFPGRGPSGLRVLEVGTGPGFFAIILAEAGYSVTAVDYTAAMLEEAKKNAGALADAIDFREMNAEALDFPDGTFDVIVSRNLTWNLPHPDTAYKEWCRVLKPGGCLVNFDANWYGYLYDTEKRYAYEADRRRTAEAGVKDKYTCTNINAMESIARQVPLSAADRPGWDLKVLSRLGMKATVDKTVWQRVWSPEEKLNFHATPMFRITAAKAQ